MNDTMPNSSGGIPYLDDNDTPAQKIMVLLQQVRDEDLADIHTQVIAEQNRRLDAAKKALESLEKAFGRQKSMPITTSASSSTPKTNNPANRSKPKKIKGTINPRGTRAPRGKAKELILAFLEGGPKSRKEIGLHFKENKLPTSSIGTLLNRLKNDKMIGHNEESKLYSVISN